MSKFLIKTTEQWRCDTESEAKQLIESAQKDSSFTLTKHASEYKERKQKGELIDAWYRVTLTKTFTDEKEPDVTATVSYNTSYGAFPSPVTREDNEDSETLEYY